MVTLSETNSLHLKIHAGWWQLKHVLECPSLLGEMIQFDLRIFLTFEKASKKGRPFPWGVFHRVYLWLPMKIGRLRLFGTETRGFRRWPRLRRQPCTSVQVLSHVVSRPGENGDEKTSKNPQEAKQSAICVLFFGRVESGIFFKMLLLPTDVLFFSFLFFFGGHWHGIHL